MNETARKNFNPQGPGHRVDNCRACLGKGKEHEEHGCDGKKGLQRHASMSFDGKPERGF
jgi:hypothetical protein